ncbi:MULTISPECIES: hypothetical protein [unclassified Sphingomonas]|uniref:hypothetical protein n=1 Tax=unclassified Sphingomonas TaxID=196159 RepID=UPI000A6A29DF|nr:MULTISPECIES: hypothetical protein [unclassified Sphingomonas]
MVDACMACGKPTPIHKLDAKPSSRIFTEAALNAAALAGEQFEFLACAACYGPGYVEGQPA